MQYSILLETVAVMVLLMCIGYFGARRGIFSPDTVKAMSALVFNVFLASSSFTAICNDAPDISGLRLVHIMIVLSVTMLLPYLIGDAAGRIFLRNNPAKAPAVACMSIINTLMFGLPIVQQVYGGTSVMYFGLSSVAGNLLLYTYGIWRLLKSSSSDAQLSVKAKDILSPVLIATLLGLLFLVARLPVPNLANRFLNICSSSTLPMSMIVVGATMASGNLVETFTDKRVYLASFIKLIICPAIVWLILMPLTDDALLLKTSVIIAACPSGSIVPVLSLQYDHDAVFASRTVIMSTLLAVITVPMFILILG